MSNIFSIIILSLIFPKLVRISTKCNAVLGINKWNKTVLGNDIGSNTRDCRILLETGTINE